jgi:hypothetical protein
MSTSVDLAYRRTYPMPHGFTVEFVLDGLRLECEWSPRMPRGKQARRVLAHYQAARNEFLASLGVPMLVVDLL